MATKYTSKLKDRRVLVLGGTSGIGFAVAEACVEYGANVVVSSSNPEKVNKTVQTLTSAYPEAAKRVRGQVCDISGDDVEANFQALFEFATNGGKDKLDHVVHTAGSRPPRVLLPDVTAPALLKSANILIATIILGKVALKYLNPSPSSSLTFTTGVMCTKPVEGVSAAIGFATGREGLTRSLALDMKPIRVNCVSPGAIQTPLLEEFMVGPGADQMRQFFADKTLVKQIGAPEDVAEAYIGLMKNNFMTGQVVQNEGGYLLS